MTTATNPLPVELEKDNFAIVDVADLRVRSQPGLGEGSIKYVPTLPARTTLLVVDGPTYADGYWWYQVHFKPGLLENGTTEGWVAAGTREGEPWISYADVDPGCDPAVGCPCPSADPEATAATPGPANVTPSGKPPDERCSPGGATRWSLVSLRGRRTVGSAAVRPGPRHDERL